MKIKPIKKSILFTFTQELSAERGFENKTDWGFSVIDKKSDMDRGRWAQALYLGPEVRDIEEGDYIFIEPLQWTNKMTVGKMNFWMTSADKVMIVSKEKPETM